MISTTRPPATPGAAPSAPTAAAAEAPASPFDAILTLEALMATTNALDPAVAAPVGETSGAAADLGGGALEDSKDDAEGDDPLAFLAGLLNAAVAAPPTPAAARPAGQVGDTDDAVADVLAGKGHRAALPLADLPISLQPQAGADAAMKDVAGDAAAFMGTLAGGVADATASKLLTAMVPAPDAAAPRGDAVQPQDAGTVNLARAVELLGHGPRHAPPAARDVIATPLRDPNWAQDLGTRVAMMVRGGESTASLQLSPVDLGPVDVNVVVRDSQATVHFGAAQAETRALLEASIPRLREMLASQGFNLMDASVSQGFARQPRTEPAPTRIEAEAQEEVRSTARISPAGLLDTYA